MAGRFATARVVERSELIEFLRSRHRGMLMTHRADGAPQLSPVTVGVDAEGRLVVSTYPQRAKARNVRRDDRVSLVVQIATGGFSPPSETERE